MEKTLNFRIILYKIRDRYETVWRILIALFTIIVLQGAFTVNATSEKLASTDMEINGLNVKADKFVIHGNRSFIECIGSVKITQESTVITADNVKVFSKSSQEDVEKESSTPSLEKLVAKGGVRIELDEGVATSEMATYNAETRILRLSGSGTKFVSDDNTISGSGSAIIVNRNNGNVTVESSDSQVEAVIFSEGDLLQKSLE